MRINSTHHLKGTYLIGASSVALTLLAGALLFPSLPDGASAADPSASTAIRTNVNVAPILSLSVGNPATNTATVEVTPTENGTFKSKTLPVTVSTNNETGYSLYLSIADGKTDNKLKPSAATNSSVINPVTGTPTPTSTSFAANTWGYNLGKDAATDATTYQAVPTTATTPQQTTSVPTSGNGDSYNLTFGTKVNTVLPADTYSTQVVLSAVTNPAYVAIFNGIKTMQEMTASICADATEGDTAQLTDTRDQKQYWVTKLADGNCWMTQNLDYDIPAGGITGDQAAKTDLSDGRTWATGDPSSSNPYPARATSTEIYDNYSSTGTYSWDPGMYVKADPADWEKMCGSSSGIASFADTECQNAGWTNVDGYTALTEEQSGTFTSVDSSARTYDAHYLVGNFYQWNTATAGTGGTNTSTDATDSICPKGWKLPSLTQSNAMFLAYQNKGLFTGITDSNPVGTAESAEVIVNAPLYLAYGGGVLVGSLRYAGEEGGWWSSTAYSSSGYAYYFAAVQSMVIAGVGGYRDYGVSIRCLAPSA